MKKRPSTGQVKFVPFLRSNASFGHCNGGCSTSCNGIGGGGGGACSAGVVGACGAGSSWQEKTTTTNYNTYVVLLIPGVSVAILMILGLQQLSVFLVGMIVVLGVVVGL